MAKKKSAGKPKEKVAQPEFEQRKEEPKAEATPETGAAEGIIHSLGNIIPGLGELFKHATKLENVKERLKNVDEELNRKLKDKNLSAADLNKAKAVISGGYKISSIKGGRVTGTFGAPMPETSKPQQVDKVKNVEPGEHKKEQLVDIIQEKTKVKVIAELPGVSEKDIKLKLKGKKLTITAPGYKKTVELPAAVKKAFSKRYKNNILEVTLEKKS